MNNTFEPSVFLAFIGFHGTIYCFSTISFWSEIDWPKRKPWFMENLTIYLLFPFGQRYNDQKENFLHMTLLVAKWPISLGERCSAFLKYRVQLFAFQLVSFMSTWYNVEKVEEWSPVAQNGNTLVLIE